MSSTADKKPNILFAISDDQSWPHAGAYGCRFVNTPAFDRVAREGVLFGRAYCPAPQCSPSRAAILTGRNIWELEEAGTHASNFPLKFTTFTDILEASGYFTGYTGKPWAPGSWKAGGRTRNPVGPEYNTKRNVPPSSAISDIDYTANFLEFLKDRKEGQPFFFWYGCAEPHRDYEAGEGIRSGKRLEEVTVPPYLPDCETVRSDMLDYAFEIDWFDNHLGRMLAALEAAGELDNTIIAVTSDNGMPFPRAKANVYENSTHIPLALRWGSQVKGGRQVEDFVSLIDLAPTFLEAAGQPVSDSVTGRSLIDVLMSEKSGLVDESRSFVLTGRERHTHAREDNLGYPCRSIRTAEYLYVWNMEPERWPVGEPEGYYDIDNGPTKAYMIDNRYDSRIRPLYDLAFAKRPAEELYVLDKDGYCLRNAASDPGYAEVKRRLRKRLEDRLLEQRDPRLLGRGVIFESYPRYLPMRPGLSGFQVQGEYNPAFLEEAAKAMSKWLTSVSIEGSKFKINGKYVNEGRRWKGIDIEGLLFNTRMVQGIFDDANPETAGRWAYPDTGKWDADRNTREFIKAMPLWREHGVTGFTINLQGGSPEGYSKGQPWHNSAFSADGSLDSSYMARLEKILNRADELGMVCILGYFYFGQDGRLKDEEAVRAAVDNATSWVISKGYTNVLIEIDNECDISYKHEILKPERVHELIERVKAAGSGANRLLVSTSYGGGSIPRANVLGSADFVLIHGNGVGDPGRIGEMVSKIKAMDSYKGQPILFNEDDHFDFDRDINNMLTAVRNGASWGYFDPGANNYTDGYQCPPVNWGINTERKKAFFKLVNNIVYGD